MDSTRKSLAPGAMREPHRHVPGLTADVSMMNAPDIVLFECLDVMRTNNYHPKRFGLPNGFGSVMEGVSAGSGTEGRGGPARFRLPRGRPE